MYSSFVLMFYSNIMISSYKYILLLIFRSLYGILPLLLQLKTSLQCRAILTEVREFSTLREVISKNQKFKLVFSHLLMCILNTVLNNYDGRVNFYHLEQ